MPRIYGKAGDKVDSGVIGDQFGGSSTVVPEERSQGTTAVQSRPNVRIVTAEEANGSETTDVFVVTSKSSSIRDLADVGNGSAVGIQKNEGNEAFNSDMSTGIEIKKSTDNSYY
jgi:hypothetical protein